MTGEVHFECEWHALRLGRRKKAGFDNVQARQFPFILHLFLRFAFLFLLVHCPSIKLPHTTYTLSFSSTPLLFRDGRHFLPPAILLRSMSIHQSCRASLEHLHHHPHVARRLFGQHPEMPALLLQQRLLVVCCCWWWCGENEYCDLFCGAEFDVSHTGTYAFFTRTLLPTTISPFHSTSSPTHQRRTRGASNSTTVPASSTAIRL